MKRLLSALCKWQSWPQVFPASLFLPSIRHGDSDARSFLSSTACQLQDVDEKSVFVFLSLLLKQLFCNYQSSCIKGEKRHKDLKCRETFMPEHFKMSFACFIDHQIILHSIIQMKCSWVQLITVSLKLQVCDIFLWIRGPLLIGQAALSAEVHHQHTLQLSQIMDLEFLKSNQT